MERGSANANHDDQVPLELLGRRVVEPSASRRFLPFEDGRNCGRLGLLVQAKRARSDTAGIATYKPALV